MKKLKDLSDEIGPDPKDRTQIIINGKMYSE